MSSTVIERLNRHLTLDEFDTAKTFYADARAEGIPATRAAAICYRLGRMQGIEETKRKAREGRERARQRYMAKQEAMTAEAIQDDGGNADE